MKLHSNGWENWNCSAAPAFVCDRFFDSAELEKSRQLKQTTDNLWRWDNRTSIVEIIHLYIVVVVGRGKAENLISLSASDALFSSHALSSRASATTQSNSSEEENMRADSNCAIFIMWTWSGEEKKKWTGSSRASEHWTHFAVVGDFPKGNKKAVWRMHSWAVREVFKLYTRRKKRLACEIAQSVYESDFKSLDCNCYGIFEYERLVKSEI